MQECTKVFILYFYAHVWIVGVWAIWYRSFSLKRAICLSTEPPVFSKMTNFQKQSRKTKSCFSWKYSNVILQTLLKDPSKGCKRLQIIKNEGQVKRCHVPTVPLHSSSFPPLSSLFSQLLHQLLAWLKNMTKSPKFWLFWLKTRG